MATELIKQLLEAGVHFGHQTRRWNPKMRRFIFGQRGGIHIIDLEKTVGYLNQAGDFLKETAAKGGQVLFIGTKKQAQDIIEAEAKRGEVFYVQNRWMGGLLTNFETVKQSIEKLENIERMEEKGIFSRLTKKEVADLNKQKERLLRDIGGIREMKGLPKAIVIVDTKKEHIALKEATKLRIPVVGYVDTNCDPDNVTYPVPTNDDAVKAIKFITQFLVDKILEGRKQYKEGAAKAEVATQVETKSDAKEEQPQEAMAASKADSKE